MMTVRLSFTLVGSGNFYKTAVEFRGGQAT
jgi:hypothetical protein